MSEDFRNPKDTTNAYSGGSIVIPSDEKELKTTIVKLKSQNETLRGQLRDLSQKLTDALEKIKPRNPKPNDNYNPHEFKEETLTKELENSNKQINMYKKEINTLRNRVDTDQAEYKIVQLENMFREREKRIEELTLEKRNLEKVTRDQHKELESFHKEEENQGKIKASAEDVKALRARIRDLTEKMRHEEKNFKKQQEHITVLEQKYKEICGKLGISPVIEEPKKNKSSVEQGKKVETLDKKLKSIKKEEDEDDEGNEPLELTEENLVKLKKKKKILKQNLISLEKKFKLQIEGILNKIKAAETDKKDYDIKLKDKEKEIELLSQKVTQFKKTTRHNALQPINNSTNTKLEVEFKSLSKDDLKKAKAIQSQPTIRKEVIGKPAVNQFDDKEILPKAHASKITKIIVWFDDKFIYGVQAFYSVGFTDFIGEENVAEGLKETASSDSLEINTDDHISSITGKYNEGIVSLRIQTFKGIIKEFGDAHNEGDEYEIQIKSGEKTSTIFGSFLESAVAKQTVLASFGLLLIRHDKIDEDITSTTKE